MLKLRAGHLLTLLTSYTLLSNTSMNFDKMSAKQRAYEDTKLDWWSGIATTQQTFGAVAWLNEFQCTSD